MSLCGCHDGGLIEINGWIDGWMERGGGSLLSTLKDTDDKIASQHRSATMSS